MGVFKFIFSKTFLIQLAIAAVVFVILAFLAFEWLESYTRHGELIKVPDLTRMELDEVDEKLDELNLRHEVIDSANYNPDYPPYSVIEHAPEAGQQVKDNRMIYLTLNPSGYAKVEIPDNLIRLTRRQVESTLLSLGFKIGEITYQPDIAEDVVLEMRHNGKTVQGGDKLKKTATIDLVLGDGSLNYNYQREENENQTETEPETSTELNL